MVIRQFERAMNNYQQALSLLVYTAIQPILVVAVTFRDKDHNVSNNHHLGPLYLLLFGESA